MKLVLTLIAAVGLIGLGCSTNQTTTPVTQTTNSVGTILIPGTTVLDTNKLTGAMKLFATIGAQQAIISDPSAAAYLPLAVGVLQDAITTANYSPTDLAAKIQAIAINGKTNPQVTIGLTGAISAYQIFFGQVVSHQIQADNSVYALCLKAMVEGINAAANPAK